MAASERLAGMARLERQRLDTAAGDGGESQQDDIASVMATRLPAGSGIHATWRATRDRLTTASRDTSAVCTHTNDNTSRVKKKR